MARTICATWAPYCNPILRLSHNTLPLEEISMEFLMALVPMISYVQLWSGILIALGHRLNLRVILPSWTKPILHNPRLVWVISRTQIINNNFLNIAYTRESNSHTYPTLAVLHLIPQALPRAQLPHACPKHSSIMHLKATIAPNLQKIPTTL